MTEEVQGKTYPDGVYKEYEAAGTITPGEGIEISGIDSGNLQVQPVSSVEPTGASARFAVEQSRPPRAEPGDTSPIDQDYESGENVEARVFDSGEEVENALLAAGGDLGTSSEADVSVGDKLAFNDDGTLKEATTAGAEVAVALEANNNSGASAGNPVRIRVEVI
jgi:hypothetical protein